MKILTLVLVTLGFVACDSGMGYAGPPDPDGSTYSDTDNSYSMEVRTSEDWSDPFRPYQCVEPRVRRPIQEPYETPLEKAILDRAMLCDRAQVGKFDRALLRDLLRFEEEYKVPRRLRGMVLAAACHESGFNPGSEGDHKFSTRGKPKAIGILQQWEWWTTSPWGPKIDRRNPRQAARAWVAHVVKQVPKVRKDCHLGRPSMEDRLWKVAWLTAIRRPSKIPRCYQTSQHWKRFVSWRKSWEYLLEDDMQTAGNP